MILKDTKGQKKGLESADGTMVRNGREWVLAIVIHLGSEYM